MNLVWITNASYEGGHMLMLTFNDGKQGVVDLKSYTEKYPAFAPLKDVNVFSDFALDGWTVTWLNGRLDIAPETLYARI